jgi:hypothetical protein
MTERFVPFVGQVTVPDLPADTPIETLKRDCGEAIRRMEALRFPGPRIWTPQWLRRWLRVLAARRAADGFLRRFFGALDVVWVAEVRRCRRFRAEIMGFGVR